jgi:hypothetical protein
MKVGKKVGKTVIIKDDPEEVGEASERLWWLGGKKSKRGNGEKEVIVRE